MSPRRNVSLPFPYFPLDLFSRTVLETISATLYGVLIDGFLSNAACSRLHRISFIFFSFFFFFFSILSSISSSFSSCKYCCMKLKLFFVFFFFYFSLHLIIAVLLHLNAILLFAVTLICRYMYIEYKNHLCDAKIEIDLLFLKLLSSR